MIWVRKKVISFDADVNVEPQLLRLFITGGAGVGKFHLISTIRLFLEKTFTDYVGTADKPKVLVPAPTGVIAINVDGTTIYSGLGIPVNCRTQALMMMMIMMMMMMMMNCFCGVVDRRKAFSLISSRDHCQRSSPSRISDTPRAGFEPAQNLSSGFVE